MTLEALPWLLRHPEIPSHYTAYLSIGVAVEGVDFFALNIGVSMRTPCPPDPSTVLLSPDCIQSVV